MRIFLYFTFFIFFQNSAFTQGEGSELPDPNPANRTDEYEMIILDGDTVLRNKITKELYSKSFRKIRDENGARLTTDWMNTDWDTKKFNPFSNPKIQWPISIDFSRERFTMPIDGQVTSRYGWRRGRAHKGIDLDLRTGDNVKVALDGKVRFAQYYGGFGNVVVVRHNNGLETVYAHLSKILVKPNTYVYSGQVLGKGGNTGRSYGSHLHFEVHYQGEAINPEYIFNLDELFTINSNRLFVDEFWADPRKHRSYKKSNIQLKTQPLYAQQITPPRPAQTNPVRNTNTTQGSSLIKEQSPTNSLVKERTHVIQRGDTLGKIAQQYSTTINELCRLNGISRSSVLRVGQELKVN